MYDEILHEDLSAQNHAQIQQHRLHSSRHARRLPATHFSERGIILNDQTILRVKMCPPVSPTSAKREHLAAMNIAPYIDHTLLRADATLEDIRTLCSEAVASGFAAVCIPPVFVREAKQQVGDSGVLVSTVVGFPFGYHLPAVKTTEAEMAIMSGADELDMVINITALKSGDWRALETEVREVLEVVKLSSKRLKVIIESGILTEDELQKCCALYGRFNIDYLKTSTGYAAAGASVATVRALRDALPLHIAIKASGGIRSYAFAKELIDAGATRLGCSASMQILDESRSEA